MLITFKSNLLPDINIDTGNNSSSGVGDFLGRIIQPSVEVMGSEYAPYGSPAFRGVGVILVLTVAIILLIRKV